MEAVSKQALRFAENLTLPTVIVMSANMGCNHCRQRVYQVLSKMNGLVDYVVDIRNRQVIVRGLMDSNNTQTKLNDFPKQTSVKKKFGFTRSFGPTCFCE